MKQDESLPNNASNLDKNERVDFFAFKNHLDWFLGLQQEPNPKWVKSRDIGKNRTSRYLPIEFIEAYADIFFKEVDIIENEVGYVDGQIVVNIKLSVLPSYPNSEHRIIAGVGAKINQINKAKNSLEYGIGAAQSSAKANAFRNFANIFGRNLNHKSIANDFSLFSTKFKELQRKDKES